MDSCSNLGVIWLQNTCSSDRSLCLGKMVKGRKKDADEEDLPRREIAGTGDNAHWWA